MYAFVSGKYDGSSKERPKPLTAVNFLRIVKSITTTFCVAG